VGDRAKDGRRKEGREAAFNGCPQPLHLCHQERLLLATTGKPLPFHNAEGMHRQATEKKADQHPHLPEAG